MKKEIEVQRVEIINLEEKNKEQRIIIANEVCIKEKLQQENKKLEKERWSNEELKELFSNEGLLEDDGDDFDIEEIVTTLEIKEEEEEQNVMDFFEIKE